MRCYVTKDEIFLTKLTKSRSVGKVAAALRGLDCMFSQDIQNKAKYSALFVFKLLVWSKRPNVW